MYTLRLFRPRPHYCFGKRFLSAFNERLLMGERMLRGNSLPLGIPCAHAMLPPEAASKFRLL
jgi:hypothetical protein